MAADSRKITAAERTRHVKYAIRDIVVLAEQRRQQGGELFHLNIGDPIKYDFATPPHVIEAIHRGMLRGDTGYGPSEGIADAVQAIDREARARGIRNINRICVTTGASEGIELALTALVDPGDNVLIPSPGYPLYTAVLGKLGAVPNFYELDEANGWQPDVEDIAAKVDGRTKAVVVINPNNPTGSIADEATLRGIIEVCRRRDLVLFADEIYDKIIFPGERHVPLASLADDIPIVTFNGLAKNYLGPGLRVGWAILSGDRERMADFTDAFMRMARARLCANTPMQWGVRPALEGDQSHLAVMIDKLVRRRDLAVRRLNAIPGFHCVVPRGAFYAFPTIADREDDWTFGLALLQETGVVTVPGTGFGQKPGTKHLRLVLLPTEALLEQALDRLEAFVRSR